MAQVWTEEKLLKEDPLHDVVDEIEHSKPHLKHVDLDEEVPEEVQMKDGVVKSGVPDAFVGELKDDHEIAEPVYNNLAGTESGFMAADPLHDIKQELESGSPKLRHVETPDSPMGTLQDGDVIKSEVPEAFKAELKNDHDMVPGHQGNVSEKEADVPAHETNVFQVHNAGLSARGVPSGRGTPTFRISAHHGMRPGGPLSRDLKSETGTVDEAASTDVSTPGMKPEDSSTATDEVSSGTNLFASKGLPARGNLNFRVSASHGMRPGGPLSRDLKSETSENSVGGEGAGADLSGEMKPRGPGLQKGSARGGLSSSGPRRSGLARTGSGVPGEQRGGSLARTGSGVPGNSLARTGSGVPSVKGGSDLKDFSSFLDS